MTKKSLKNMQLICGMHRSGTSLVARILHESGADFGNENTFIVPDKWNPDGYYEQESVVYLNSKLINGVIGRSSYFFLPSERVIIRRSGKLRNTLQDTAQALAGKFVKDNRFCLTLPAWRSQGIDIDRLLLIYRKPLAVGKSLRKRNKIPIKLGINLWQTHYERLLNCITLEKTTFLSYDRLIDPQLRRGELTHLESFSGLKLMDRIENSSIIREVDFSDLGEKIGDPDVLDILHKLESYHSNQDSYKH